MKWSTSHGVQAHKMAIGEFAYEDHLAEGDYWLDSIRLRRGLLAVESISEGEVLVSLPWRSCITTEHLRASQHPLAGMVANEQDNIGTARDARPLSALRVPPAEQCLGAILVHAPSEAHKSHILAH